MNKHLLEMYANLVIETQEIQDGDVKKLAEGILVLVKNYDNQAKEIERLNNIIKEVREYIENDVEVYYVLDTRLNKAFDKTKKVKEDLLEILDKENKQ